MSKKQTAQLGAMLIIGNQPHTLEAAGKVLATVLAAATQDGAQIAACNALAAIAHAPTNVSVSGCNFENRKRER